MASEKAEQSDLWSATDRTAEAPRDPRRRLLPHDLDVALKYLTDGELQALTDAVSKEKTRRSPQPETASDASPPPSQSIKKSPKVEGLTKSQISLIRSSIQAGVKPAVLSRQFGLTRAQITAALNSDE
ncbi:MAG: hypothetical protein RI571_15370 [Roseovarius sp.]|jgi:hypothetical protein|nr:hypothetical protein [Roseovarius sp.]